MTKAQLKALGYTFKRWQSGSGVKYIGLSLHGRLIATFPHRTVAESGSMLKRATAHHVARILTDSVDTRTREIHNGDKIWLDGREHKVTRII